MRLSALGSESVMRAGLDKNSKGTHPGTMAENSQLLLQRVWQCGSKFRRKAGKD